MNFGSNPLLYSCGVRYIVASESPAFCDSTHLHLLAIHRSPPTSTLAIRMGSRTLHSRPKPPISTLAIRVDSRTLHSRPKPSVKKIKIVSNRILLTVKLDTRRSQIGSCKR
uniref:Uncharacterized protein n=1 Tax=Nelumbo nucifera TaxID=4432 RepID=A0A822ZRC4_NELNU|nr:TPA_asm: hypothetical protein HUJ06_002598 [Nelumbo nucifera]